MPACSHCNDGRQWFPNGIMKTICYNIKSFYILGLLVYRTFVCFGGMSFLVLGILIYILSKFDTNWSRQSKLIVKSITTLLKSNYVLTLTPKEANFENSLISRNLALKSFTSVYFEKIYYLFEGH